MKRPAAGYDARPLLRPRLILCLLALLAPLSLAAPSRAQDDDASATRLTHLASLGIDGVELLARTEFGPDRLDSSKRTFRSDLRRRFAGAGPDRWQSVASFSRPILAMADLGNGEIALLLGESAGDGDPATRPAATQLRKLAFRGGKLATVDPVFNPAARPVDVRLPDLPDGVVAIDVATASGDPDRRLHALATDGNLYRLDADEHQWTVAIDSLPGTAPLDLADAGVIALAMRDGDGINVFTLDGDGWTEIGGVAGENARIVEAVATLAGGPAVFVGDGEGGRLVRWRDGAAAAEQVVWAAEGESSNLSAGDPVAAAYATGSIRLTRAVEAAEGVSSGLIRLDLDGATLAPLGEGRPRRLNLDAGLSARAENVLTLIVWGLVVLAFLGLLRQPRRRAEGEAAGDDEAVSITQPTPFLRIGAGMIDALPIVFALGIFAASSGELPRATNVILFAVGLVAYIILPMVGELLGGRSMGKMVFGLRVVSSDDSGPASAWGIVLRNVVRPIDLCGGILAARFTRRAQRLGDLLGHTAVVRAPVERDDGD